MFGCQSSEIFRKKPEFLNSRNFCKKVWKCEFQKFQKKYVKFEFLSQKTLLMGIKDWEKFKKSSGKAQKKFGKVWKSSEILETGFSECLEILEIVFFYKISENYKKMMLNSNFGNREKLVPTRKPTRKFG